MNRTREGLGKLALILAGVSLSGLLYFDCSANKNQPPNPPTNRVQNQPTGAQQQHRLQSSLDKAGLAVEGGQIPDSMWQQLNSSQKSKRSAQF
ncbi:MAG TPA: hypothetical protein VIF64_20260 [Pyrinomonadaceae bacterium]